MFRTTTTALSAALLLAASTLTARAYSGEILVTCRLNPQGDNFLALRNCGSTRCAMLAKLGPDSFMLTLEPYAIKGWRQVIVLDGPQDQTLDGPAGWVYEEYACPTAY
ncbi:hypothetical protein [Tropicimonas sp. IMCC6043]|uniref:hypothetical protein n=1 Tax=Tropicimonas sp. IMCC6043 TaxID=2510645 RepID=UPI00101E1DB0|nr:hypothetical protein [Tropicimonas sp. IMCC6043]RYH07916.1 hypothetical protein EU800_18255 [Tropicimonas sp. IMCC6043]